MDDEGEAPRAARPKAAARESHAVAGLAAQPRPRFRGHCPTLDQWDHVVEQTYETLVHYRSLLDDLTRIPATTPKLWNSFVIALFSSIPEETFRIIDIVEHVGDYARHYLPSDDAFNISFARDMVRAATRGSDPRPRVKSPERLFRFVWETKATGAEVISLAKIALQIASPSANVPGVDLAYKIEDVLTRAARFRAAPVGVATVYENAVALRALRARMIFDC